MNAWIDIMENCKAGLTTFGVDFKKLCYKNTICPMLYIYSDRLPPNTYIENEVSKFDFSEYYKNGTDITGASMIRQKGGKCDIVIENIHVTSGPLKVLYHKDGKIYVPNVLYKNCCIPIEQKGIEYHGVYYQSCVGGYD